MNPTRLKLILLKIDHDYSFEQSFKWSLPVRIRVRIYSQYPLVCRKRRLNRRSFG
jgi:hypothetical protein